MGTEKKRILGFFLYVSNIITLLWLAPHYTIAAYIVYSQTLVYLGLAIIHRKMRLGPTGEEIWTGKKAILVALVSLVLFLTMGVTYADFRVINFLKSAPFGLF